MSHLLALYMGSLILRSIGIALIAGICSWKIRNVAIRHAVWVVALGCMLLMPVVDYLLPASWVPARIQQIAAEQPVTFHIVSARAAGAHQPHAPAITAVALPTQSKSVDLWSVAATLYALVAFAMFIRLALGYRKIRRLRRTGRTISSPVWEEVLALHQSRWRIPVLLESEAVHVPMTIGLLCPAVILPTDWKSWDDWKVRAVLLHEIAHIRRNDWGIAVIAAAGKCAYWLNPLFWFVERKLSQLAEQACDDASLCRVQNATRYAEILLEFTATTQHDGRLIRGGVAMAHHKIQERIERVLGKPQPGTGIVKIAGWVLVMFLAVPIMYSAAALQVTSEPVKAPVARYAAEFGWSPMPQVPVAGPQIATQSAPATVATFQQDSPNPVADPRASYPQMEVLRQQLKRQSVEMQENLQAALKESQANGGPPSDLQRAAGFAESVAFVQDQLKKMEDQSKTLQSSLQQQSQINPALTSALLDLPDNRDDLLAYLKQLARLRNAPIRNLFLVFFAGIQGRTISMKVAQQNFAFGCENCSFFVGESVVSSAASEPQGPGIMLRLSPDGNELTVGCHAALCNINFEGGNSGQQTMWQFASGDSETFAASKLRSVVISKD